jgi:hypothetical protein
LTARPKFLEVGEPSAARINDAIANRTVFVPRIVTRLPAAWNSVARNLRAAIRPDL